MPGDLCNAWGTRQPAEPYLWEVALQRHLDRLFVEYVIHGLEQVSRIGFNGTHPLSSASRNMASAYAEPQVVPDYLQAKVALGHILGPLSPPPDWLAVSKFGVILKNTKKAKSASF